MLRTMGAFSETNSALYVAVKGFMERRPAPYPLRRLGGIVNWAAVAGLKKLGRLCDGVCGGDA